MTSNSEIRKLCEELVKAAVELAIVRHDLCRDDDDMDVSAIAEDVANAVIGIETCAEEPIPEYTALREKLEAERATRTALQERITAMHEKLMGCKNTDGCDECDYYAGAFNSLCAVYSKVFNEAPELPSAPEVQA